MVDRPDRSIESESTGTSSPERISGLTPLRILLITALLAGSLWFALRNLEWSRVLDAIGGANPFWVVGVAAFVMAAHVLRAIRWRLLIPEGKEVGLGNAFRATILGYFANNVIPRSGELLRPWILARRENRSTSRMLATVVVERTLDSLTLLVILASILVLAGDELVRMLGEIDGFRSTTTTDLLLKIGLPIVALLTLLLLVIFTRLGDRVVGFFAGRLPERFGGRLQSAFSEFRAGATIPDPGRRGPAIVFWTLAIWLGYALSLHAGVLAFGFESAYGLDFGDSVVILGITTIGVALAPTPGGFGVFHSFARVCLVSLYAIPLESAIAFALVVHAAQYLVTMIVGGYYVLAGGRDLHIFSPRTAASTQEP